MIHRTDNKRAGRATKRSRCLVAVVRSLGVVLCMLPIVARTAQGGPRGSSGSPGPGTSIAGDTLVLDSSGRGSSLIDTVGAIVSSGMDSSVAQSMDPLVVVSDVVSKEGVDKAVEKTVEHYRQISELSRNKCINEFNLRGKGDKGKRVAEIKTDAAAKAGFLAKVGAALKIIDLWGAAWRVVGAYSGSGGIGASSVLADEAAKKAAAAGGALVGTWAGGPAGSVVCAVVAEEVHDNTLGVVIKDAEQHLLDMQAMRRFMGIHGGYSGKFEGGASGTITMKSSPGRFTCSFVQPLTPPWQELSGSCTDGEVDKEGKVSASISGSIKWESDGKPRQAPFEGALEGRINGMEGSGTFEARGQGVKETGTWTVTRIGL